MIVRTQVYRVHANTCKDPQGTPHRLPGKVQLAGECPEFLYECVQMTLGQLIGVRPVERSGAARRARPGRRWTAPPPRSPARAPSAARRTGRWPTRRDRRCAPRRRPGHRRRLRRGPGAHLRVRPPRRPRRPRGPALTERVLGFPSRISVVGGLRSGLLYEASASYRLIGEGTGRPWHAGSIEPDPHGDGGSR